MPRIVCVVAAWLFLLTPSAIAADSAGQKMQLPAKERNVDVTFFRAPGDAPRPSVLLLHGANGFDSQIAMLSRGRKYLDNKIGDTMDMGFNDMFFFH